MSAKNRIPHVATPSPCMTKVDRLGWAAGRSIVSFGVRVGVRASRAEALPLLLEQLPRGWAGCGELQVKHLYSYLAGGEDPEKRVKRFHLVYSGIRRVARTHHAADALAAFATDVRFRIASFAPRWLFLRAGVVGWRGRAILLPGMPASGTSRLVAALVTAGATYYSDDYAVIDSRGQVHPFGRQIRLRDEEGRSYTVALSSLDGKAGTRPLPVGMVGVSPYKSGASWRPRTISSGQGLLELLACAIPARRKPRSTLSVLQGIVFRSVVLKGARGEAGEAAQGLLTRLDRSLEKE